MTLAQIVQRLSASRISLYSVQIKQKLSFFDLKTKKKLKNLVLEYVVKK